MLSSMNETAVHSKALNVPCLTQIIVTAAAAAAAVAAADQLRHSIRLNRDG